MRHLTLLLLGVIFCLTSCHNNEDEPNYEFDATINLVYVPAGITFEKSDTEFLNKCRPWDDKFVIVNSSDELPADPLGFNDHYDKINFSDQTLLIYYSIHNYRVVTCRNVLTKNIRDNVYNWLLNLGIENKIEGASDKLTISRYAILVPKITQNDRVKVNYTLTALDFNWEE